MPGSGCLILAAADPALVPVASSFAFKGARPPRRRLWNPRPVADLALVNANVLTMDPGRPRASAVVITGGRIEAVAAGPTPFDPAEFNPAQVVDLRGATLLPGFNDAHNHMTGFGMSLAEVDLRSPPVGSLDELYAAIARRAQTTAPGTG